jgi:hypothetical protein
MLKSNTPDFKNPVPDSHLMKRKMLKNDKSDASLPAFVARKNRVSPNKNNAILSLGKIWYFA